MVTQRNGTPILVRDLGKLKLANQERHGILGENRKNDAVEGTVLLLKGDNPSRVIEGIHAKVAELNERLKADDVQIVPYIDRADLVNATLDKVSHTILMGVGLVFIVLLLFLGSLRSAADRRPHHPVRPGDDLHPDESHQTLGQPAVARRHRFRHHRRRRHRDDGGDPAPPRGGARRGL